MAMDHPHPSASPIACANRSTPSLICAASQAAYPSTNPCVGAVFWKYFDSGETLMALFAAAWLTLMSSMPALR